MEQYQAHHVNQDLIFQTLRHLCFSLVFPTVPKRTVLKTLFSIKFFKCPRPDGAQNLVFSQIFSTFETKPCSKPGVFPVFPEFPDYTLLKTLCFPSFSSFFKPMEQVRALHLHSPRKTGKTGKTGNTQGVEECLIWKL